MFIGSKIASEKKLSELLLALLPGCGDGTRGTGAEITGNVRSLVEGISPTDLTVSAEALSLEGEILDIQMTKTDRDGNFRIRFDQVGPNVAFDFSSENVDARILIENIAEDLESADIDFEIDDRKRVRAPRVDAKERPPKNNNNNNSNNNTNSPPPPLPSGNT